MSTKTRRTAASSSSSVSSSQVPTSTSREKVTSPLSPTRLTRLQEKYELQNLNDRLAAYIDRVRWLETENNRLSVQVQTTQETVTHEVTSIKSMYERELSDARKCLDDTAKEKARLQVDNAKWKAELDEVSAKLKKKEKDYSALEKKFINSESHNQTLQSRFNQLTAEKNRVDDALKEAEAERNKLAKELSGTKSELEETAINRVDLLNKLQSLKEEITFKETVHEQELSESRILKHTDISDIDLNLKENYEQKLADTLKEIREVYETQMKINRDEIESLYEGKLSDLQKILDEYNTGTTKARNELRGFKTKVESLTSKIKELESQNDSMKSRIKDLEALLEQEREWHQQAVQMKDDEIRKLREDVEQQLQEYQDLLDIKVALDMEIAAYRKLLEVEESRLNISTPQAEVQRSTPRRTPLRGKRKRTSERLSTVDDFQSSASAKGDVEVSDHDTKGKFVKIFNKGNTDVPLGGWQLIRRAEDQETIYKFHRTMVIRSNSYVTVWSSDAGVVHSPPSSVVMKGQKWFVSDKMNTVLMNNNGEEMASRETSKRVRHESEQQSFAYSSISEELYHQDSGNPPDRCVIM